MYQDCVLMSLQCVADELNVKKTILYFIYGAGRDRTDDLLLAKQAFSQLNYGPAENVTI